MVDSFIYNFYTFTYEKVSICQTGRDKCSKQKLADDRQIVIVKVSILVSLPYVLITASFV